MSIQKKKMFHVYRPNTGLQQKQETIQDIKKSYEKVGDQFTFSDNPLQGSVQY